MLPHDYLNFLLTGNYVAECGDASGTALFNGIRREWSKKICNLVDPGLINLLPDLIDSDKPAGKISRMPPHDLGSREIFLFPPEEETT